MKVAVLGAGGMGETVVNHLRDCELVDGIIAYDIRAERVDELQGKGVNATLNLQEILADPAVRLCFVTSSNDTHMELVLQALEAGKAVMS